MDQPSARLIAVYGLIALVALLVSVVDDGLLGAVAFIVGVMTAAVGFLVLVWSRVDMDAVKRVLRDD